MQVKIRRFLARAHLDGATKGPHPNPVPHPKFKVPPPQTLTPTEIATLQSAAVQAAIAGAKKIALLQAAATGRYFTEYPEDIQMLADRYVTYRLDYI